MNQFSFQGSFLFIFILRASLHYGRRIENQRSIAIGLSSVYVLCLCLPLPQRSKAPQVLPETETPSENQRCPSNDHRPLCLYGKIYFAILNEQAMHVGEEKLC
jgi:hypothetical protein